jgi:hypothetical protein
MVSGECKSTQRTNSSVTITRGALSEYIALRLSMSSVTAAGEFKKTRPWPKRCKYTTSPGTNLQFGQAQAKKDRQRRTIAFCPIRSEQPELFGSQVCDVPEQRPRLGSWWKTTTTRLTEKERKEGRKKGEKCNKRLGGHQACQTSARGCIPPLRFMSILAVSRSEAIADRSWNSPAVPHVRF